MNRTILDYLGFIITTFGTIFGAISIYIGFNQNPDLNLIQWLLIIISTLFFVLFLIFLQSSIRNKRYKKAYSKINRAFSVINELFEDEKKINDLPTCLSHFEQFCTHVSDTFKLITNRKCSACIKIFEQTQKLDVCAITFCRDYESKNSEERVNPEDDTTIHYLRENTDFIYIFDNIDKDGDKYKYYFSNALPFEDFYKNTRINSSKYPPNCNIPIIKETLRCIKWHLPYRSTITVPITLFSNRRLNEGKIAGYLCVDSPRMNAFNRTHDTQILRGIADGIYSSVRKINEIHFNNIHKNVKIAPKSR
jgi:uncharacterized membrane protein